MADGKIRVSFEPKGDKELIDAIKSLNRETKKLRGINVLTEKSVDGVAKAKGRQNRNAKDLDRTLFGLGGTVSVVRAKLLLYSFAINQATQFTTKLVKTNAGIQDMGRAFDNLVSATGLSSDTFKQLDDAVDGTMTKTELFKQANNAMVLGVFDSTEQMSKMFDAAQRLGKALGRTSNESIESLVSGLGRQSKLMLDNIGIMLDVNDAYEEYADIIGVSVDSLTDQERKQAFVTKATNIALDAVANLGKEQFSTTEELQKFSVAIENFQATVGEAMTPTVELASKTLKRFLDSIDVEEVKSYGTALGVIGISYGTIKLQAALASIAVNGFSKAMTKTGVGALVIGLGLLAGSMLDAIGIFEDANKTIDENKDKTDSLSKSVEENKEVFESLAKSIEESEQALAKRLRLLEADTELEKEAINLGRELTETERGLIELIDRRRDSIERRNNAIKLESSLSQQMISSNKEKLDISRQIQLLEEQRAGTSNLTIKNMEAEFELIDKVNKIFKEQAGLDLGIISSEEVESIQTINPELQTYINSLQEQFNLQTQLNALQVTPETFEEFLSQQELLADAKQKEIDFNNILIEQYPELSDKLGLLKETTNDYGSSMMRMVGQVFGGFSNLADAMGKDMKTIALLQKAQAVANMYASASAAIAPPPVGYGATPMGFVAATAAVANGVANVLQINNSIKEMQKFETGGLVGGRRHSQGGTVAELEQGEFVMSRNAVSAIGVENLNRMNDGGGGGSSSINISINGGMISPDFVENELAESIREAVRRGADFGIS
jgi:hypothetical protein